MSSKIVITGDDILIEYVTRIVNVLRKIDEEFHDEDELSQDVRNSIKLFVEHHVWQKGVTNAQGGRKIWAQMETRLGEMLERRRRLIKYNMKKERESAFGESEVRQIKEMNEVYESQVKDTVAKKQTVVGKFTTSQLEDLLTSSTKNIAHEVVSCMIPVSGQPGLLQKIEQEIIEINQSS